LIRDERLRAQLLSGTPGRDPVDVVERILAVQGQDPRGARLAIRARSKGLSAADVDDALSDDRSLVISWLNRGTLHLVRSEDYPWLHALTAPTIATGNASRLKQEGLSPGAADKGVRVIERSLAKEGPLTREELAVRLRSAGVIAKGQGLVHLLVLATIRGLIVRGPMKGKRHAFVLVHDWLPRAPRFDRDAALRELSLRYLAGHAPASDRDFSYWSGLPLRDTRKAFELAARGVTERPDGLFELKRGKPKAALPKPKLLGAFDPVLHGWASRELITGKNDAAIISGGLFRPFALVDGTVAARWSLAGADLSIKPVRRITTAQRAALDKDAADVLRFLGLR
jgi:hypothetical protein